MASIADEYSLNEEQNEFGGDENTQNGLSEENRLVEEKRLVEDERNEEFARALFPLDEGNKEMLMLNMEDQRQQLESRFEITNNQLSVGNTGGETCHREENITRHHGLDMEGPPNVSLVSSGDLQCVNMQINNPNILQLNQVAGDRLLNISSGSQYTEHLEFWNSVISKTYSDITLRFQDGELEINRGFLAVISRTLRHAIQDSVDYILLPGVHVQQFLDLLQFSSQLTMSRQTPVLQEEMKELITLLDSTLFLSPEDFKLSLPATHVEPRGPEVKIEDPFAPGYSAASASNGQLNISPEKLPKDDDYDKDSFIDDNFSEESMDDFSDEEFSKSEQIVKVSSRTQVLKRGPGRPPKDRSAENSLFAEVELVGDIPVSGEDTLDSVVQSFLNCHSCRSQSFHGVRHLIQHFAESHGWEHTVDHCVYCDTPFMAKSVCSKHEKDKCQNVSNICYKCGVPNQTKHDLLKHLVSVHAHGIKRKCPHCELNFLTLAPMQMNRWPHLENCSARPARKEGKGSGGKTCSDCGGSYRDSWKHKRQCTATNRDIKHVCCCCKKGFRRLGTLKHHFILVPKCQKDPENQLEYSTLLRQVERNETGTTVCSDCGMEFQTRKGSLEHRKNCSAFTRFKCFACNRGMNALDGFHIHFNKYPACRQARENKEIVSELMARSIKPDFHVCHLCGAQYKAKESIDKHMLTHSDHILYFTCPEVECGKKFLTSKSLDMHVKNHLMPMVICSICGKQVKQGSLSLHMVLHTGKKVNCPVCGKLFQHKGVLNKHIRSCHVEKKLRGENRKKKRLTKENEVEGMQIQVEVGDLGQNNEGLVKVSLPQMVDNSLGRQVVGLVNQAGQVMGHALLDTPQSVEMTHQQGQQVLQAGQILLPNQFQRFVVPPSGDMPHYIQVSGQPVQILPQE